VPLEHLRLLDLSDREFLLVLADVITDSGDGWADSLEVAQRLGIKGESPRRTVACRLSWLARWGAAKREHRRDDHGNIRYHKDGRPMHTQRWALTGVGADIAQGALRKTDETALERLRDEQLVLVARWLNKRSRNGTPATMTKLVEREWRRGTLLG